MNSKRPTKKAPAKKAGAKTKGPRATQEAEHGSLAGPLIFFQGGCPQDVDLMSFEIDESVFGGRLATVVAYAREILEGESSEGVLDIIRVSDAVLGALIDEGGIRVRSHDGHGFELSRDTLPLTSEVDLLWYVANNVHETTAVVEMEDGSKRKIEVNAPKLCAAFCLAQAAASVRYGTHPEWLYLNGAYHGMQAAEAMAIARMMLGKDNVLGEVLVSDHEAEVRSRAGKKRWENDSTQPLKAAIKEEYERWYYDRSEYRKPGDFKTGMVLKYQGANFGTIGNWMTEWGVPPRSSSN